MKEIINKVITLGGFPFVSFKRQIVSEILKDESLINQLQTSKKFAAEINQRVKDSKITEA